VKTVPLKRVVGINLQTLPETTEPGFEFRYVDIGAVSRGQLNSEPEASVFASAPSRARRLVRQGDTIISTVRTYLRAVWPVRDSATDLVVSTGFAVLTPTRSIDSRYLGWLVQSDVVVEEVVARSVGVSYPAINPSDIGTVRVPLPPLARQRSIADYLDRETARIDALIEKKQRMIGLIRERALVRQELLATGRSQKVQMGPSGHDWLGPIPENWSVVRLKHYARIESGHTPSRTRPELWENCTIPWVTLNDVGYLEAHEWVEETVNLISEAGIASSSARVLPAGTVILSRDATVGRCGILARPMTTSQHFIDWICGQHLRPRYLWLLLRTAMQTHFASLTDGATLRTIGMPDIGELVVPLPPLDQQDLIVEQAEEVRKRAGKTVELLDKQVALLQEHRQALITAAVTGKLEVPEVAV
jgi:type I restriction enzyme S subunit